MNMVMYPHCFLLLHIISYYLHSHYISYGFYAMSASCIKLLDYVFSTSNDLTLYTMTSFLGHVLKIMIVNDILEFYQEICKEVS